VTAKQSLYVKPVGKPHKETHTNIGFSVLFPVSGNPIPLKEARKVVYKNIVEVVVSGTPYDIWRELDQVIPKGAFRRLGIRESFPNQSINNRRQFVKAAKRFSHGTPQQERPYDRPEAGPSSRNEEDSLEYLSGYEREELDKVKEERERLRKKAEKAKEANIENEKRALYIKETGKIRWEKRQLAKRQEELERDAPESIKQQLEQAKRIDDMLKAGKGPFDYIDDQANLRRFDEPVAARNLSDQETEEEMPVQQELQLLESEAGSD
jgi:hypothetical protein